MARSSTPSSRRSRTSSSWSATRGQGPGRVDGRRPAPPIDGAAAARRTPWRRPCPATRSRGSSRVPLPVRADPRAARGAALAPGRARAGPRRGRVGGAALELIARLGPGPVVLCTHGDVMEALVGEGARKKKGATWLLARYGGAVRQVVTGRPSRERDARRRATMLMRKPGRTGLSRRPSVSAATRPAGRRTKRRPRRSSTRTRGRRQLHRHRGRVLAMGPGLGWGIRDGAGTWMKARGNGIRSSSRPKAWADGAGAERHGLSRHHIVEGVEASLRGWGRTYIDLYQARLGRLRDARWPRPSAFDDRLKQGRVLYLGASPLFTTLAARPAL